MPMSGSDNAVASPPDLELEREALALFCDVVELEADAVEDALQQRAAGRPALVARVRELLAADAAATPAGPMRVETTWVMLPDDDPPSALPPERVGPYRLRELIGSGGMGSVYRADRDDGLFEQAVAVKFVRSARGAAAVQPLVDAERRLLARMQHPGIARILDGGCTDNGLHYLVMEFVDGRALDEHARAAALDRPARVTLLREVCAAVAHAHGHGVIHCDLKPANILVGNDGRVRLIDFGVARLQDIIDGALPQGYTPAYASPQRVAGGAPTVADDVYALGVVLCELVGGAVPVPSGVQVDESALGVELAAVARRATAADAADRYATVAAFDDDLRRWLENRPVDAVPDGWRYRLHKLVQRRPWHTAAAAAAVGGIAVSLAVISLLYSRAEQSRQEAERRFAEVRSLANYLLFDLDRQLESTPGTTPIRRQMVGRAQAYLDALAQHTGTSAELKREVAVGLARLGEVQGVPGRPNVGEPGAAGRNLERAEALLGALTTEQPSRWAWRGDLGQVRYLLALLYGGRDNDIRRQLAMARDAETLTAAALRDAEQAGAPVERLAELQVQLTSARLVQADAHRHMKDHAAALALQRAEEARLPALPEAVRRPIEMDYQLGRIALLAGDSSYYLDRKADAMQAYRRGAAHFDRGLAAQPLHRKMLTGAMHARWFVGSLLGETGQHDQALAEMARAEALGQQLRLLDPDNRQAGRELSSVRADHAGVLASAGRLPEAIRLVEADLVDREARLRQSPESAEAARDAVVPLRLLADYLEQAGRRADACRVRERALAAWLAIDHRWGLTAFDREGDVVQLRRASLPCRRRAG